jgi:hypothetical protein
VLTFPLAGPTLPEHAQQALAATAGPGQRVSAVAAPPVAIEFDSH